MQLSQSPRDPRLPPAQSIPAYARFAPRVFSRLEAPDLLLVGYFLVQGAGIAAVAGPNRALGLLYVAIDLTIAAIGISIHRSGIARPRVSLLVYRAALVAAILASYLQLQTILADFAPHARDAELAAFDARVFGIEPAVAWDRFVSRPVTEWFSFFYFGYFFVVAAHVLPLVFSRRDDRSLRELTFGLMLVFCVAQTIYMIVPAYGPYREIADTLPHRLEGYVFWPLVRDTVTAAGAQLDAFPSVHTATPTFFALHAFRHRGVAPFRWSWPLTAFFALQIVISTMFLRWHYLVDVLAGILLASAALWIAARSKTAREA